MRIYDEHEAARLNAEPWQLDLLKLNPEYVLWGPGEDHMTAAAESAVSFSGSLLLKAWKAFDWELDELNECVNFYFSVVRAYKDCPMCGGDGYHPAARAVVNTFYAHMNDAGEHWNDKITQDELDALIEAKRIEPGKTVEEVNANNAAGCTSLNSHDAINRWILISARLKRLGLPEKCEECEGNGSVFTESAAHVELILWMLHPRKGASRGVQIARVEQDDLPAVFQWLRGAAERNAGRFAKVVAKHG
jgi:hypothetical protein